MEQERRIQLRKEKIQKRKKRKKLLIKIFFFLLFVGVMITLSLTVFFKIEKITVSGKSIYSETDLISASEIKKQTNLFLVNREAAQRRIENKYPDIGEIEISIELPNEIVIKDTGYSNLFALKSKDGYIIIDREKNVRRKSKKLPSRMIFIQSVEFEEAELYKPLQLKNDKQFESVLTLVDSFNENELTQINSISVESLDNIQATYNNKVTLVIGNLTNLTEKIKKAKHILELEENKNKEGTLDLTVDNTAYFK